MARTATKTASILTDLYGETFTTDFSEPIFINWPDLRGIAGVAKLTDQHLCQIIHALNDFGYTLWIFDNFLVFLGVNQKSDLSRFRIVAPRFVEQYLYDDDDDLELGDEELLKAKRAKPGISAKDKAGLAQSVKTSKVYQTVGDNRAIELK